MKKRISLLAACLLVLTVVFLPVMAETEAPTVYVNIANAGELVVAREAIAVTDVDEDGALTIQDLLVLVHDAKFEGGSAEGFAVMASDYGPMITKLWGVENGGSYGYYLNNAMAMSLLDPVADGDCVTAYVFADTATFSDVYTYFDVNTADGKVGDELTVTLYQVGFDANYAPVSSPLGGVSVTANGAEVAVTDEEGKAVIKLESEGEIILSAASSELTLVPPVCLVTVAAAEVAPAESEEPEEPVAPADTVPEAPAEEPAAPTAEPEAEKSNVTVIVAVVTLLVIGAAAIVIMVLRNKKKA